MGMLAEKRTFSQISSGMHVDVGDRCWESVVLWKTVVTPNSLCTTQKHRRQTSVVPIKETSDVQTFKDRPGQTDDSDDRVTEVVFQDVLVSLGVFGS